jgi:hypothetical protein
VAPAASSVLHEGRRAFVLPAWCFFFIFRVRCNNYFTSQQATGERYISKAE